MCGHGDRCFPNDSAQTSDYFKWKNLRSDIYYTLVEIRKKIDEYEEYSIRKVLPVGIDRNTMVTNLKTYERYWQEYSSAAKFSK